MIYLHSTSTYCPLSSDQQSSGPDNRLTLSGAIVLRLSIHLATYPWKLEPSGSE